MPSFLEGRRGYKTGNKILYRSWEAQNWDDWDKKIKILPSSFQTQPGRPKQRVNVEQKSWAGRLSTPDIHFTV